MAKTGIQLLGHRITLRDARGHYQTLSRATRYQIFRPDGKKFFSKPQSFPEFLILVGEKRDYLAGVIRGVYAREEKTRLKRRVSYWERRIREKEKQLMRARSQKRRREIADELRDFRSRLAASQDALLDVGIERETLRKKVYSEMRRADLRLKVEVNRFDPILFREDNLEDVLRLVRPKILDRVQDIFRERPEKRKQFILRVLYQDEILGKKEVMGFGLPRTKITRFENLEPFVDELLSEMNDRFVENDKSYFRRGFVSPEPELTGFTIEVIENERRIPKERRQSRMKQWDREKALMSDEREETKERLAKARKKRLKVSKSSPKKASKKKASKKKASKKKASKKKASKKKASKKKASNKKASKKKTSKKKAPKKKGKAH